MFERNGRVERRRTRASRSRRRSARAGDARAYAAAAAAKALWWGAAGVARGRWPGRPTSSRPTSLPLPIRRPPASCAAPGCRPSRRRPPTSPPASIRPWTTGRPIRSRAIRRTVDFIADAIEVEARRRRGDGRGGARRGAGQLPGLLPAELPLPDAAAGSPPRAPAATRPRSRRCSPAPPGPCAAARCRCWRRAWRARDHRGLALLDLACGAGAFLRDLALAFPRARLIGVDLSPPTSPRRAPPRGRGPRAGQGRAAAVRRRQPRRRHLRLPVPRTAAEGAPRGRRRDRPGAEARRPASPSPTRIQPPTSRASRGCWRPSRPISTSPTTPATPTTDLPALFAAAGLRSRRSDPAFLTKAMLFEKLR